MLLAILISLFAAVIPALLYSLIFYWADRYEREPKRLVIITFVWGALPAIILSLIFELALDGPINGVESSLVSDLVSGSVVAPIVEELAKGAALLAIFLWRRQEFDGVLDGVVYGALVGFGFAMTENFLYFVGAYESGGFGSLTFTILLRAIVFGLNHAFYTSLIGIGLGLARNKRSFFARAFWFSIGLGAAILAHALHNLGAGLAAVNPASLLISLIVAGGGLATILLTVGLSWQHERNILDAELSPEIGRLISPDEFALLVGRWRTPERQLKTASHRRRQLAEYANRRYRLRRQGITQEPELEAELQALRAQLTAGYPAT